MNKKLSLSEKYKGKEQGGGIVLFFEEICVRGVIFGMELSVITY